MEIAFPAVMEPELLSVPTLPPRIRTMPPTDPPLMVPLFRNEVTEPESRKTAA